MLIGTSSWRKNRLIEVNMEFKNKPQELGEGTYQCTLDEATLEKAKLELNEDPEQKATQIEGFRQWVKAQPHMSSRMGQLQQTFTAYENG